MLLYGAFTVPCMQKTQAYVQDDASGIFGIGVSLNYTLLPAEKEVYISGVNHFQLNLVRGSFF